MSLNLFVVPDVDYRYEAQRWVPFKPASTGKRPILSTVPASDNLYDLNEAKLEIKIDDDETAASDANDTK